jgi:hypothetical protein
MTPVLWARGPGQRCQRLRVPGGGMSVAGRGGCGYRRGVRG